MNEQAEPSGPDVRRALVTGASSGIGAATAETLAAAGYAVWLTYAHDEVGGKDTAERCLSHRRPVELSHLDLRSPSSIAGVVAEIDERWGSLHVLVNNGAVCPYRPYHEIEVDEWDEVLETNARGTFLLTRAALPLLRAAGEPADRSVVNVSSIAGQVGALATGMHYAASKAAILAITRSFARLLAEEGIRVNAVCPGPVTSRITDHLTDQRRNALASSVPLGRFGTPDEVAWIIAGLAAANASFVTGATYDVNGGARID